MDVQHHRGAADHLSAEFRGRARQFRDKIAGPADVNTAKLKALVAAAAADCRRGYAGMRLHRVLPDLERKWRALTGPDRLDLSVSATATTLQITDVRIVRSLVTHVPVHGDVNELALTICVEAISLRIASPRRIEWSTTPMATISFHALGRYFARGRGDDDTLLGNLRLLATEYPRLVEHPGEFILDTPDGGWRGLVCDMKEPNGQVTRTVNVRTFL